MVNNCIHTASQMQRMQWTPEQRAEALKLLAEVGKAEAARRLGIPAGTIAAWGARSNTKAPPAAILAEANAARFATIGERKAALAETLLTEAEAIVAQLRDEAIERKPMVVSDGATLGSHIEIAEVRFDRPPTADQKRIVETVAILVNQVQLLTGAATERVETVGIERTPEVAAELAKVLPLVRSA